MEKQNDTGFGSIENFLPEILAYPIFQGLKKEQVLELLLGGVTRSSKHREYLYRQGDPANFFSIVLRGAYKLTKPTPQGDDVILYFSCPGDAIGALVMAHPMGVYPVSVVAMGPSLVWQIPKKTYQQSWMTNASVTIRLQNLVFNRMSLLQGEKTRQKTPVAQKVAYVVLQLIEKYSTEGENILPVPVTRKEIADSIGSSVESVIRVMSEWSQAGLVRTNESHIEVLNTARIVEMLKQDL